MTTYTNTECVQFVRDMQNAGLEVEHYVGPEYWQGPAVTVENLLDATSVTEVELQWDTHRLGLTVYPVASDAGIHEYSAGTGSSRVIPRNRQGGGKHGVGGLG